ncbi:MAG: cupin domain-containing protein [Methylococcaceae bacterium]|nr:cupin domain-containing protein [Methylococcaceae bacterium]
MTKTLLLTALLALIVPAAVAEEARQLLEHQTDADGVRIKTRVTRVNLPVGYKTPLHTHESPGPRYVLKGRIKIEESGQSHIYGPGDAFWESGQWMTAENVGEGEVELLITEINPGK